MRITPLTVPPNTKAVDGTLSLHPIDGYDAKERFSSMGFGDSETRRALKAANGNFKKAMFYLTYPSTIHQPKSKRVASSPGYMDSGYIFQEAQQTLRSIVNDKDLEKIGKDKELFNYVLLQVLIASEDLNKWAQRLDVKSTGN